MTLAADVGFAGLPLCIKTVEDLVEALVGGFAGVDGAASARTAMCR